MFTRNLSLFFQKLKTLFAPWIDVSLTPISSQRENWFVITPFIAEFWCCLSNFGFLYVAWYHKNYSIAFAGIMSIISHACPLKLFLLLDKIGVIIAGISLFLRLKWCSKTAYVLILMGGINFFDFIVANHYSQTWSHVLWHISAAYISNWCLNTHFLSQ